MFKSMFYYAGLFKHNQTICAAYENPTSTNLCPISKSLLPRPAFVFHFICDEETELTVNQMMSEWKLSNVQWFFHSSWPHLVSIRSTVNARHCSNTLRQKFTCWRLLTSNSLKHFSTIKITSTTAHLHLGMGFLFLSWLSHASTSRKLQHISRGNPFTGDNRYSTLKHGIQQSITVYLTTVHHKM